MNPCILYSLSFVNIFDTPDRWTVDDLGRALEMAPSAVRRKLAYWQGQGLVKEETPDVFVLVQDRRPGTHDVLTTEDDEQESAMASAAQQREEEMQVFGFLPFFYHCHINYYTFSCLYAQFMLANLQVKSENKLCEE